MKPALPPEDLALAAAGSCLGLAPARDCPGGRQAVVYAGNTVTELLSGLAIQTLSPSMVMPSGLLKS